MRTPLIPLLALALFLLGTTSVSAVAPAPAPLAIDVGSTGADGIFNPQTSVEIDLATQGTYDPVNWRVVFNYQSVHVPAGVIVTFKNHPSRAPVVWLSQGDIVIEGTVNLNGQSGGNKGTLGFRAEPGPGGFRGGAGGFGNSLSLEEGHSAGLGPGGGQIDSAEGKPGGGAGHSSSGAGAGSLGGTAYGDPEIRWLVGGSGAAGTNPPGGQWSAGGGAGGGAILLAANSNIHLKGTAARVDAGGGNGGQNTGKYGGSGGAGGAVRAMADTVTIDQGAAISTNGGFGGFQEGFGGSSGYVRLEANSFQIGGQTQPAASLGAVGTVLPPMGSPTVRILQIGGEPVPADPLAELSSASAIADVDVQTGLSATVVIQTTNVPLNAAVYLHNTRDIGQHTTHLVTDGVTGPLVPTGGAEMEAQVSITLNLPHKHSALQARVVLP